MNVKKIGIALLIVLMISSMVFAAGQREREEPQRKVKLIFSVNETPILTSDFWAVVSNRFMEQYPDVIVENIAQPSSNIQHRDYLKTLLATGQFPDVMVMASPMDFVSSGALMELPVDKMTYLKDPSIGKIEGKSYVAVYKYQVGGFWYNRTKFQELGIDEPQTYNDLLALSEVIKRNNLIPISMGLKDGWPQLVLASMLLSSDVLAQDSDWGLKRNNGEVTFSDDNVVRAMEKFQELVTRYANSDMASVTYAQKMELFFSGRALMLPMGSWVQGEAVQINPNFEVGFFPVPSDTGSDTIAVWANEGLAINAHTKYPQEALDFINFFFNDTTWYAQFLQTEMLFPGTKTEVPYEMSDLRKEVGQKFERLRPVEHWYDMTGDAALLPRLQAYFNRMTQRIAMGGDVRRELALYDREWDLVKLNQ